MNMCLENQYADISGITMMFVGTLPKGVFAERTHSAGCTCPIMARREVDGDDKPAQMIMPVSEQAAPPMLLVPVPAPGVHVHCDAGNVDHEDFDDKAEEVEHEHWLNFSIPKDELDAMLYECDGVLPELSWE